MTETPRLNNHEWRDLLRLARDAITSGLHEHRPLEADVSRFPETLRQPGASFVTLKIDTRLRGCIGSLTTRDPLVIDVARNAYAAAFSDPRFPPLTAPELPAITIQVSVLGPATVIPCRTEDDLLGQLRPGIDGLILEDGDRRATFLPSVWESLPNPETFVRELKRKAGLPAEHWSPTLIACRYSVICRSETD